MPSNPAAWAERKSDMDTLYIIVKNVHGNPKLPVRYGIMGNGLHGFCLYNGQIVCFKTFEEANAVLESFTEPHWFDIIEYRKFENINN